MKFWIDENILGIFAKRLSKPGTPYRRVHSGQKTLSFYRQL